MLREDSFERAALRLHVTPSAVSQRIKQLDAAKNPKKLKFKKLEAPLLPRALSDVNLALINTNNAIEAKLNPTKNALFIEGAVVPAF